MLIEIYLRRKRSQFLETFIYLKIIATVAILGTNFLCSEIMQSIPSLNTPDGQPEFIHLDTKYACLICSNVLRDAVQTTCGHRTCNKCLENYFEGKEEPVPCPAQEEDCEPQYKANIVQDRSVRREIRDLLVFCSFKTFGCKQEIRWKDLESHAAQCNYRLVECPNKEYGCTLAIPLVEKDEHATNHCNFRLVNCQYCMAPNTLSRMEEHIAIECPNAPLRCRFGCDLKFSNRDELNQHLQLCPMKPLDCKFKLMGCQFAGNQEVLENHYSSELNSHLELVTLFTANLDVNNLNLRRQIQEVTIERDRLKQEVTKLTEQLQSVTTESSTLRTQIEKLNKDNKDLKLKMVSMTERIIHLERKSEDMAKKEHVERHDQDVRALQSTLTQVRTTMSSLESRAANWSASGGSDQETTRRLENIDSQLAQVDVQMAELDLRFQILETANYDGELLWKLRDYQRRKAEAVSGKTLSLYSQPFYTHRFGYKMCARVYLNGDGMGKGSHLSLFFVVMRGEYDNLLPWPFQQKVTMILLDQETGQMHLSDTFRPDPTSSSFRKPTTEMNIASGCPLFVAHTILESSKYIKDDTLFIKFKVDTTNLNHP